MTNLTEKLVPILVEYAFASDKDEVARKKILQGAAFLLKEGVYETIDMGITDGGIAHKIGIESKLVSAITNILEKEGKIARVEGNPDRGWEKVK